MARVMMRPAPELPPVARIALTSAAGMSCMLYAEADVEEPCRLRANYLTMTVLVGEKIQESGVLGTWRVECPVLWSLQAPWINGSRDWALVATDFSGRPLGCFVVLEDWMAGVAPVGWRFCAACARIDGENDCLVACAFMATLAHIFQVGFCRYALWGRRANLPADEVWLRGGPPLPRLDNVTGLRPVPAVPQRPPPRGGGSSRVPSPPAPKPAAVPAQKPLDVAKPKPSVGGYRPPRVLLD